jgi:hypothetical protein
MTAKRWFRGLRLLVLAGFCGFSVPALAQLEPRIATASADRGAEGNWRNLRIVGQPKRIPLAMISATAAASSRAFVVGGGDVLEVQLALQVGARGLTVTLQNVAILGGLDRAEIVVLVDGQRLESRTVSGTASTSPRIELGALTGELARSVTVSIGAPRASIAVEAVDIEYDAPRGGRPNDIATGPADAVAALEARVTSLAGLLTHETQELRRQIEATSSRFATPDQARREAAGEATRAADAARAALAIDLRRLADSLEQQGREVARLRGDLSTASSRIEATRQTLRAVSTSQARSELSADDTSGSLVITEQTGRTILTLGANAQRRDGGAWFSSANGDVGLYVGAGGMALFNEARQRVIDLQADSEGVGSIRVFHRSNRLLATLGASRAGSGGTWYRLPNGDEGAAITAQGLSLRNTSGSSGDVVAIERDDAGNGIINLRNSRNQRRIAIGTSTHGDGALWVTNRNGAETSYAGGGDLAEMVRRIEGESISPGAVVEFRGIKDGYMVVGLAHKERAGRAVGIVSGAGDLMPAITLNRRGHHSEVPLALAGTVFVQADASIRPIEAGDFLVASAQPGFAESAAIGEAVPGAIIGRAIERLSSGTGLIRIWVGPR